jgi:hypothetical protein
MGGIPNCRFHLLIVVGEDTDHGGPLLIKKLSTMRDSF